MAKLKESWIGTERVTKLPITWTHNNKMMGISLYYFKDPQKDNGISLINPYKKNAYGLLMRNYRPKLMSLKKINDTKSLKRKIKKAKNKYTKKSVMGKNEVWKTQNRKL